MRLIASKLIASELIASELIANDRAPNNMYKDKATVYMLTKMECVVRKRKCLGRKKLQKPYK